MPCFRGGFGQRASPNPNTSTGGGGGGTPNKFLSTTGSDSNSGLDISHPWQTFSHAWASLVAGDIMQVADGTYSSASPPAEKAGSVGNPITVQAANAGGVHITDGLSLSGNSYLTLIGLLVSNSAATCTVFSNGVGKVSHHLIIQQCGFHCTVMPSDDANFYLADGTHHCLVEDCWAWGGGRYTFLIYGGGPGDGGGDTSGGVNLDAPNNIIRRLVTRNDQNVDTGNPAAGIAIYYASGNIIENCICIDGIVHSSSSNSAFYCTGHGHPPTSSSNQWLGCLSLHHNGEGFYCDTPGATADNGVLKNCVFWDIADIGLAFNGDNSGGNSAVNWTVDHCTVGAALDSGTIHSGNSGTVYTNNLHINNTGFGIIVSGIGGIGSSNHNGYFNNSSGPRSGLSAGIGDLTSNPNLLYIGRIESGSAYHNAGSSGDIGADITKRYQDGILTGVNLWPWPNEARIKSEMAVSSSRGFAGDSSLTHYVWNYLGNGSPF